MEQIVRTLQDILIRAIPTFVLFIGLCWYMNKVLIQPLQRILAERRKRTEGAVERAESALAQAARKMADYELALADARAGIYAGQEDNRSRLVAEQAAAAEAARVKAAALVAQARIEIAAETETARAGLAAESDRLADRIASAVLAGKN
jgi:F-type H+-transporting ATPase subunit b